MANIDLMYFSIASILPPTLLSIIKYRTLTRPTVLLSWFLYGSCVIELIAYILFQSTINNMFVYHIHTAWEFIFLACVYYNIVGNRVNLKKTIVTLGFMFGIFSVLNLILWEKLYAFNSYQRGVEYLCVMIFLLFHFSTLLRRKTTIYLEIHPYFILSLGLFIYFSGTIILFLNVNNLLRLGQLNEWGLHSILNIFINVIYFIVIWKSNKHIIR